MATGIAIKLHIQRTPLMKFHPRVCHISKSVAHLSPKTIPVGLGLQKKENDVGSSLPTPWWLPFSPMEEIDCIQS